jgi:hypothetical protein
VRILAGELPYLSYPVSLEVGNDDWRRVVSAHNTSTGGMDQTVIYVRGIKFGLLIDSLLSVEVRREDP